MSTIKPFEIIMRPYLWDLSNLERHPKCPNCLGEIAVGVYVVDCTSVHCSCRRCDTKGPNARISGDRENPGWHHRARLEAAKCWNQYIERIYHLAHGVIPAPSKKED